LTRFRKLLGNGRLREQLAKQIVAAAQGDARLCYDFLDILNAHVTRMLQEKKR
jgi:hypothetical protein